VENEWEGCYSARLAAYFIEQPMGTTENSEEGFIAVRRGGRRERRYLGARMGGPRGEKVVVQGAGQR
jgi:hypothetical protein